jgi:hypothetical protein
VTDYIFCYECERVARIRGSTHLVNIIRSGMSMHTSLAMPFYSLGRYATVFGRLCKGSSTDCDSTLPALRI